MIGTMTSGTGLKFTVHEAENIPYAMLVEYREISHIEPLKSKKQEELYDELLEKMLERTNVTRSDVQSDLKPVRAGDTFAHRGVHYEVAFYTSRDGLSYPLLREENRLRNKGVVLFGLPAKQLAGDLCVLEKDLVEFMEE